MLCPVYSTSLLGTFLRTALITGIAGQDGSYLADLLLEKGYRVVGVVRPGSTTSHERIAHQIHRIELVPADLLDQRSLSDAIYEIQPDEVYNLAAHSFVPTSWEQPVMSGDSTALGVTRMLEAIRKEAPKARFYQASSSELFGKAVETPQRESTPFYPRSPYGVAKAYGHWITVNYREGLGMYAVSGILFNHESPRRGLEFVTRKVTDAAARISLGLSTTVQLGNLDARRDWGFAGDYVDAMWRMLQQEEPSDFVIGSGETWSVRDLCELAFDAVGLEYAEHIRIEPNLERPVEARLLVADASKARTELDWKPKVGFPELVRMMVTADVARHRATASTQ
ncbi:MAG: GDP-mannose 4,6-dehydratase [Gemmatimonadaceae bacterium]